MDNAAAIPGAGRGSTEPATRVPVASWATRRKLRIVPWRGDPRCMLIGPARNRGPVAVGDIQRAVLELEESGVRRLVTPAMNRYEADLFYQAGFSHLESLHLLMCRLRSVHIPSSSSTVQLSNARRRHFDEMLRVDSRAFQGFWQFDHLALREARSATSHQRSRLARVPVGDTTSGRVSNKTVGYAVTGRARNRGYLQRLAVDPVFKGRGIGSQLVYDAFRWLSNRGADTCLVNTQESNVRALALYERLGFERQPEGLVVLYRDLNA